MSKLLIDEEPLQVLPRLAVAIGLNEAIFVQQLHYWLRKSKHEHDGRVWIYNTYEEWHEQFPFWSLRTLQRIAARLVKLDLIVVHQFNKEDWDRRNWYSINYESPYLLGQKAPRRLDADDNARLSSSENATLSAPMPPDCRLLNKDTETTTETTNRESKSHSRKRAKPASGEKDLRSEHPAILSVQRLMKRYPDKLLWDGIIERLGDDFDAGKLEDCRKVWLARGYNPNSLVWIKWYAEGIPSQGNGKPAKKSSDEEEAYTMTPEQWARCTGLSVEDAERSMREAHGH